MKRFIIRLSIFSLPIFCLLLPGYLYRTDKGDLMRLGYMAYFQDYDKKKVFKDVVLGKTFFKTLNDVNLDSVSSFDVLTVGDSFSNLQDYSYENYLAYNSKRSVLNIDSYIMQNLVKPEVGNPLEFLERLLDTDFFSKVKVRYVIVESVERDNGLRGHLNSCLPIRLTNRTVSTIRDSFYTKLHEKQSASGSYLERAYKCDLNYFFRMFSDQGYKTKVYSLPTKHDLFSYNSSKILFFADEIEHVNVNAQADRVTAFNTILNDLSVKLAAENITMIVLPAPDKYDIYYDYIENAPKYPRPVFFDLLKQMPKRYTYIDAKRILTDAVKSHKDVYLYDDTHWSPLAAELIAKQIDHEIENIDHFNMNPHP